MSWLYVVALLCLVGALVFFVRGDASQGSAFVALAVVFLVVGRTTSAKGD